MLTTCLVCRHVLPMKEKPTDHSQIFLGVPHRFESQDELEDQLHKLILLPGPKISRMTLVKVKHLAKQVNRINHNFLETKLLERASVFNFLIQSVERSLEEMPAGVKPKEDYSDDAIEKAVTPFKRYAHFIGHSFEGAGRWRWNDFSHLDFVREEGKSKLSGKLWLFNDPGYCKYYYHTRGSIRRLTALKSLALKVGYRILSLQTRLMSLAPPTRATGVPLDPVFPDPPVIQWLRQHESHTWFEQQHSSSRILHIHANGNRLVDVPKISRLFHASKDKSISTPQESFLYFEFDQYDSRYSTLSAMLTYLINALSNHLWHHFESFVQEELQFLSETRSWTFQDLYHIYSRFRSVTTASRNMTLFISCFDQCPLDERKWFMERLLSDQSYSSAKNLVIITTSSREGLGIENPPNSKVIDLVECPFFNKTELNAQLPEGFKPRLKNLLMTRPVYNDFQSHIRDLIQGCNNEPHLGQIILNWLASFHRGSSKIEITAALRTISPISSDTIVDVVLSSLDPILKVKAEIAFNWVKVAAEPWSPGALVEAINIYLNQDQQVMLDDLDKEEEIAELVEALASIIIIEGNNVKFSHPSFYTATRSSRELSIEESTAQVHHQIATACLLYFQLENAQATIDEFCSTNFGQSWVESPLDTVVICRQRVAFAEYAVRFWPYHYKASGQSRPKQLVYKLFSNKRARVAWSIPYWLLSNSFTRIDRHYMSVLPVFASLGLEDLLNEQLESEKGLPWFNDDCWFSITEAVRSGSISIVQSLLELVEENEKELQTALFWAAAQDDDETLDLLLAKAHNKHTFVWPDGLIYRAAATGRTNLLSALLDSGASIDAAGTYWGATASIIAAWRNQVSALDLILNSDPKPDLTAEDNSGDSLLMAAVRLGNPRLIKLIVNAGAPTDGGSGSKDLILAAIESCSPEAVDILLEAGAKPGSEHDLNEPPIVFAAASGLLDCVRVMLRHKADLDVNGPSGTALYRAVEKEHIDIVRLLLENDPKPSMDITSTGQDSLLIRAVLTNNTELVSLLIEHGAKVDFVDSTENYNKTPLSRACKEGYLDMVKLLLNKGADVNYTGDISDAPLFAALYNHELDVARHLLQIEDVDVMWRDPGGMGTLHGAYNNPEILPNLLLRKIPLDDLSIWGTPLHMMARDGCLDSIDILLKNVPKPDLEAVMGENAAVGQEIGLTPLQLACREVALPCIKALLEAGANHKVVTNDDDLVDIVLQVQTSSSSSEQVLELLLSAPYSLPVDRVNHEGRTRLHIIHRSTSVAAFRLLIGAEPKLDARNDEGYTPLAVAIYVGNNEIAEFLIVQGASVNILSPIYGSILHLATSTGALDLVKLLLKSGANPDLVDIEYGESILYTALGIKDKDRLYTMVRYLVDEAKVPINKMGGELAYPLIKAVSLLRESPHCGTPLVKFLIKRNVRLNVSDSQGRRAIHFACMSTVTPMDAVKALVKAGEDVDAPDKFGRRPIHFAASNVECLLWDYIEELQTSHVDVKDLDGWTPLMWAARSGAPYIIHMLVDGNADVWAQSNSIRRQDQWSALKLANFAGRPAWAIESLVPEGLSRTKPDGEEEKWDEYAHKSKTGHFKGVPCSSCLVVGPFSITFASLELTMRDLPQDIIGLRWECIECRESFSLCFKCFPHKSDLHNPSHSFNDIGPLYDAQSVASSTTSHNTQETTGKEDSESALSDGVGLDLDDVDLENIDLDFEDNSS